MGRSDLRHGSPAAPPRLSPCTVSARSGDDRRVAWPTTGPKPTPDHIASLPAVFLVGPRLSAFVPRPEDSESANADPPGTSLALPDRLAGDQQNRSLLARWRPLRTLPASPRASRRAVGRHRRHLVGCGDRCLAGWPRPAASPSAGLRPARCHPHDAQTRLSCHRTPQPRSDFQRAAMAQSRCPLPTVPYDPRRARASPPSLVECLPPTGVGRPLHRPIQLRSTEAARVGPPGCSMSSCDDRESRPARPRMRNVRPSEGGAPPIGMGGRPLKLSPHQRGGSCWALGQCAGDQNDCISSDPQDDRDGAAAAGR